MKFQVFVILFVVTLLSAKSIAAQNTTEKESSSTVNFIETTTTNQTETTLIHQNETISLKNETETVIGNFEQLENTTTTDKLHNESKNTEKRHAAYSNQQYDDDVDQEPYIQSPNQAIDYRPQQQQQQSYSFGYESTIPGEAGRDYPIFAVVPPTRFQCPAQQGLYGDVEARCQVWHYCQADGRKDSFLCPNGTLFNQQYLVCDWWYNVECETTQQFYGVNAQHAQLYGNRPGFGYNKGYGERTAVTPAPYSPGEPTTYGPVYPEQPTYFVTQPPPVQVNIDYGKGSYGQQPVPVQVSGGYGQGVVGGQGVSGSGGYGQGYNKGQSSGGSNQQYGKGQSVGTYTQQYGQSGIAASRSGTQFGQGGQSGAYNQQYDKGQSSVGSNQQYGQSGTVGNNYQGQGGQSGGYSQQYDKGQSSRVANQQYGQSGQSGIYNQQYDKGQSSSVSNQQYGQSGTAGSRYQTQYGESGQSGAYNQQYDKGQSSTVSTQQYNKGQSFIVPIQQYGQSGQSGASNQQYAKGQSSGVSDQQYGQSGTTGGSYQTQYGQGGQSATSNQQYGKGQSTGTSTQQGQTQGTSSGQYGQSGQSVSSNQQYGQSGQSSNRGSKSGYQYTGANYGQQQSSGKQGGYQFGYQFSTGSQYGSNSGYQQTSSGYSGGPVYPNPTPVSQGVNSGYRYIYSNQGMTSGQNTGRYPNTGNQYYASVPTGGFQYSYSTSYPAGGYSTVYQSSYPRPGSGSGTKSGYQYPPPSPPSATTDLKTECQYNRCPPEYQIPRVQPQVPISNTYTSGQNVKSDGVYGQSGQVNTVYGSRQNLAASGRVAASPVSSSTTAATVSVDTEGVNDLQAQY